MKVWDWIHLCNVRIRIFPKLFSGVIENDYETFCKTFWKTPVMKFIFNLIANCGLAILKKFSEQLLHRGPFDKCIASFLSNNELVKNQFCFFLLRRLIYKDVNNLRSLKFIIRENFVSFYSYEWSTPRWRIFMQYF